MTKGLRVSEVQITGAGYDFPGLGFPDQRWCPTPLLPGRALHRLQELRHQELAQSTELQRSQYTGVAYMQWLEQLTSWDISPVNFL